MSKARKPSASAIDEEEDLEISDDNGYMKKLGDEEDDDHIEEEDENQVQGHHAIRRNNLKDEEEDEDDEEDNEYIKDGFVVADSEDEPDAEDEEEDPEAEEERRRRKRERREKKREKQQAHHKRVLKKVHKAEPSDGEDPVEMEELEDYHEGSEEDFDDQKKRRLIQQQQMQYQQGKVHSNAGSMGQKRQKGSSYDMAEEYDGTNENIDEDEEDLDGHDTFASKMGRHSSAFQDLFMEADEPEENEDEEEKSEEVEKPVNFEEIFEPDDIKNRYEREEDRKIKEEDIPERLQLRMIGRKLPDPQEFLDETKWIYENLRQKSKKYNDISCQKKIFQFLEALHINMEEVMYIYTYRKNDFHPLFELDDLWRLYDLDQEWGVFVKQKTRILQQIQQIKKEIDNIPLLLDQLIIDPEQLRRVEEFFYRATDLQSLKFVKEYYDYLLVKIYPVEQHRNLKIRKERKSRMINTYIKANVHQQAASVSLPPYELVKNLEENSFVYTPQVQMNKPQQFADTLLKMNPNIPCMTCALDALECMADYQSNEMYYFPPLKKWVFENYKQKVYISTEPTELGKKQIDVFNSLYPAKRINKRKFDQFTQDIWLLVEEAERQNLITVKFQLEKKSDRNSNNNEKGNDLIEIMNQFYSVSLKNLESSLKSTNLEWNIFRKYNIEHVLDKYFIPQMQNLVRAELHDISEKWVIQECSKKFFSMINVEPEKTSGHLHKIMSVVQDNNNKIGVVFVDENGIPKDSMILNYFMKKEEHLVTKAREEKRIEEQSLDAKIQKFQPTVAVVAANSIESQVLKNKLHNKLFPQYGDDTIPQIISKQPVHISNSPYKEQVLTVALSQARMLLNPTAEILSLWNERTEFNGCLHIPLHPSKEYTSLDKLQSELEKCCIKIVNFMGVELDMFQEQPHLKHLLQHVCGLGPRKAMKMLDLLNKNPGFFENKVPKKRDYMVPKLEVKPTVYKNMNGFIRFRFSKDPFERTRINKEYYKIAKKICKESIDTYQQKFKTEDEILEYAMKNPKLIESIDLDDYANQLFEKKNQQNMKPVLDFIKDELVNNFYYKCDPYKPISQEDLFFKMIKENRQTFRKGMIVSAKITNILPPQESNRRTKLLVRILDNELKSSILVPPENEPINYKVGDVIKAYIDKIPVLESIQKKDSGNPTDKFDKFEQSDLKSVTLTFQEKPLSELIQNSHPSFMDKDSNIMKTYIADEKEDKPVGIEVTAKKQRKFEPRKIAHPNFKNISLGDAVKLLKNAQNGEFIIRPSSKGKQYLAISWKFFDDVFVHLSLKEETIQGEKFQTKLILDGNKDSFDNFDEVIERYIIPCNNHMNVVKDHRKFTRNTIEEIEKELKKGKEENPDIIHYAFCCIPKYPQCIVLLYCSRKDTVTKEWIRVKHQGLQFHHQYFAQFKELILWFKSNFHTSDYKRHVTKIEDLNTPKTPLHGNGSSYMNQGIKYEHGGAKNEKLENGRNAGLRCQNCQKLGHTANACKNKKQYPSSSATNQGPRQCYLCKSSDHLAKECPTKGQNNNNGGNSSRFDRPGSERRNISRSRSRSYDKN